MNTLHAWIDASSGVAGDMLLGALLDAGAHLDAVRSAIETVIPESIHISTSTVHRAGLRALKAHVRPLTQQPPHRTARSIHALLHNSALAEPVRAQAIAVFARLAAAEAHVHDIPQENVHFHEIGALDSIADVVGVCAALHDLGIQSISAGDVALGSGHVRTAHGHLPVPAPAVAELARGWPVYAGGTGELTTPTGLALIRTLALTCEDLPPITPTAIGIGAGTRDTPNAPNITRVIIGQPTQNPSRPTEPCLLLEANIDDLDPRLWPGILSHLLHAGASDAWLTPILMKKGRPAHTLHTLCPPHLATGLKTIIFHETSTLGIRQTTVTKHPLERFITTVDLHGTTIDIKVATAAGRITQANPEFDQIAELARARGLPERTVLAEAVQTAADEGLMVGHLLPPEHRPGPSD
ncbi:nickel pincer cofactor biosynthesis protein LarC [Kineosporia sp. J2-2]|uniref:Pyridinium-3,5-bisthiocarboxylic acid mononucleotide nickel insertion protein n=1 Tax=Kineosporia corallincola TaxID=2835133 RepID=A0ABS5TPG7_9ACTN|nr:nickel pincer cofactor biosynthesis protein LarC [Kineosporia corallincola]MBT0772986.1 nickel pincer cofactor biosynthesis protein LarC [Kineosporia corallincola]